MIEYRGELVSPIGYRWYWDGEIYFDLVAAKAAIDKYLEKIKK